MKKIIDEIAGHFQDAGFECPDILISTCDALELEHNLESEEHIPELASFSAAMWALASKTTVVNEDDFDSQPLIKVDVDNCLFVIAAMTESIIVLLKLPHETDRNILYLESKAAIEKANKLIAQSDI